MGTQQIDLSQVDNINFVDNGTTKEVEILKLNNDIIWKSAYAYLNYTGMDANGNLEGTDAFDGTIVAYAVGKPTITHTTAEDGAVTETITYKTNNGFNSAFFNGYDFSSAYFRVTSTLSTDQISQYVSTLESVGYILLDENYTNNLTIPNNFYIIPEEITIPPRHNGLPVKRILSSAFGSYVDGLFGQYESLLVFSKIYTQSSNIKKLNISENIEIIDKYAFSCIYGLQEYKLPVSLTTLQDYAFFEWTSSNSTSIIGGNIVMYPFDIVIPSNIINFGYSCFANPFSYYGRSSTNPPYDLNKVRVKSSSINPIDDSSGNYFQWVDTVIFENTVKSINGPLFYASSQIGSLTPHILVFEHSANYPITLNITGSAKTATTITIYTDNSTVKRYDWSQHNITATILPLNDYNG